MATFLGTAKTNNPKVAAVKITSAFGVPLVSKLKISGVLITSTGLQNQPSLLTARISTDSISNIRIQKIKLQNQPVLSGLFLQDGGRILIAKSKVTGPQGRPKTNKAVLEQALRILAVSGRNTPRIKNTFPPLPSMKRSIPLSVTIPAFMLTELFKPFATCLRKKSCCILTQGNLKGIRVALI